MKIKKLLIANRGEIAVRIIRTARSLGIKTVAVYSDADRDALHTQLADESIPIGASEPGKSYLRVEAIIDACKLSGADAVHPGYGFLSERPELSEACQENGIAFLGPSASAMRMLGAKIDAKALAVSLKVPITPGYFEPGATRDRLKEAADDIGYPIMLKASAGGGGRGMRVVRDPSNFYQELDLASEEALKSFGDDAMMVEKLVEKPRHIEVQLLADQHGDVAVIYERECSLQRRHQKVVEEAPSPYLALQPKMWEAIRQSSIALAKAAGYVGAGTVEFMVDEAAGEYYFLEVNARLQVEHPVTEEITGLDLVKCQIEIAEGLPLELSTVIMEGNRAGIQGHSIEVRIIAEDPARGFLPSVGKILAWAEPRHPGVRLDTGFGAGAEISQYYDSLIAKLIVKAPTRELALQRLRAALLDFHVLGVKTNVAFLIDVLDHPDFRSGQFDTGFLGRNFVEWQPKPFPPELGAIADKAVSVGATSGSTATTGSPRSWDRTDGFRNAK